MKEPKEYTRETAEALEEYAMAWNDMQMNADKSFSACLYADGVTAEGCPTLDKFGRSDLQCARWLPVWLARNPSIESAV
jgi:hypothetical protein